MEGENSHNRTESTEDEVHKLQEILGLPEELASQLLIEHNFNIDAAINSHFAQPTVETERTVEPNKQPANEPDVVCIEEENVRMPIPARRMQMLTADDDQFRQHRRQPVICPMRDFKREAEIIEQRLADAIGQPDQLDPFISPTRLDGHIQPQNRLDRPVDDKLASKRPRLHDLFRPPVDLMRTGSLVSARHYAGIENRWLIVNIQDNTVFQSQCLNRDLWSDSRVKQAIRDNFIFWQATIENAEGARFKIFYKIVQIPVICIIDPRTGERLINFYGPDDFLPDIFLQRIGEFITEHKCRPDMDDQVAPFTGTEPKMPSMPLLDGVENSEPNQQRTVDNLTEDEQMELAIKNSLADKTGERIDESDESIDSIGGTDDDDMGRSRKVIKNKSERYTDYLGDGKDPITKLQFRLGNGNKEIVEWPCTTRLRAIKLYAKIKLFETTADADGCKLIVPFLYENLMVLDDDLSLTDAKLHPTATITVHSDG